MQAKQFYASIELAEEELRLVVGEFYMSRFNILRVERIKTSGVKNAKIIDQDNVSASIVKALFDVEKALGLKIRSVILCIPSVDVKCIKRRVNVPIEEGSKRIRVAHARFGLDKAVETFKNDTHQFVNIGAVKYINGGISSRSIPLDEQADILTMEVDLLCVDKETVYDYARCVEAAGVNILDIYLDSYAIAEESAILENSMEHHIVLMNFEKNQTTFTLYHKGHLLASTNLAYGYHRFVEAIRRRYHLTYKESLKLLKESAFFKEGECDDTIIYIWKEHEEQKQVTRKEISACIKDEVNEWVKDVNEANEPLNELGNVKIQLTGSGADIIGIDNILKQFTLPTELYIPTTVGARKGYYSAVLGAVYCYRKVQSLQSQFGEIATSLEKNNEVRESDENAFTKKLKNILLNR